MSQLKEVILASKSPRRRELLLDLGLDFDIISADIDESKITGDTPEVLVSNLSRAKAEAVYKKTKSDKVILASDTIVVYKGKVFGKPRDSEDAVKMLMSLNGKTHFVYTGVTIIESGEYYTFFDKSEVEFKHMTEDQIRDYVLNKNPLDKAGAYGIQDNEVVSTYNGSYTNIVGLPMEKLKEALLLKGVIDGSN